MQFSKDQFSFLNSSFSPFCPKQAKDFLRAYTEKQPEDKYKSSYRSPSGKDISTVLSANSFISACEAATQRTVHSRDMSTKSFILSLYRKEVFEMYFSLLSGITRMVHVFILVETIPLVNHCINIISTCLKQTHCVLGKVPSLGSCTGTSYMVHLGMQITILELNSQVSFVFWWSNRLWQPAENTVSVIVTVRPVRITLCWQQWKEGKQMHIPMAFKHSGKGWNHGTASAAHSPVTALLSAAASWDLHVDAKHLHQAQTQTFDQQGNTEMQKYLNRNVLGTVWAAPANKFLPAGHPSLSYTEG